MKNTTSLKNTNPIDTKEEVKKSNDEHIDQDFEDFPKGQAKENIINPKTKADKLTAKTQKPVAKDKQNPAKAKNPKAGDTTDLEKKLANTVPGKEKTAGTPNKVDRIKKQKK